MRTFLKIIGALFVLILAFIVFLPAILSTHFGTSLITSQINRRIPGQIEIQNLQLSWLSGQKMDQLSLKSSRGNPILHIDEVASDRSLLSLLFKPLDTGNVRWIGLQGTLFQDDQGISNLEDALGIKEMKGEVKLSPVEVDKVNAEIKLDFEQNMRAKAVGLTHQNNVKGQFDLDFQWGGDAKALHLSAQQFPILVLDQLLSLRQPGLSGVLKNIFGDALDVTIDQSSSDESTLWHVIAKSPFTHLDLKGQSNANQISVQPGSRLQFNIPEEEILKLIEALDLEVPVPDQPFSGDLTIDSLHIPLRKLADWTGKAVLNIQPNLFKLKPNNTFLALNQFQIVLDAPANSNEVLITVQGQAEEQGKPLSVDMQLKVDKPTLSEGDFLKLLEHGIQTQGSAETQATFLPKSLGTFAKMKWEGVVKETNSEIKLTLDTENLSLPEIDLQIEQLPLREWLKTGHLTEPFQVAFAERQNKVERLKGSLRIDPTERSKLSDIQLDVILRRFPTYLVQHVLPEHDLAGLVGADFDAEFVAMRNGNGDMQGKVKLATLQNSHAFLKGFSGTFNVSHTGDVAFEMKADQVQGSTQLTGSLYDLWDVQGRLRLDQAAISVQGSLTHIPIALVTQLITGDQQLADQVVAILGSHADASIAAEIQERQGPLRAEIRGSNGQIYLEGGIRRGVLLLDKPLTAYVKLTPELERTVLARFMPLFSSVIKAEQPIELIIAKEGFALPLHSLDLEHLTIGRAELNLHRLWFGRDSQLGKVVTLLGINANTFEVWFTPIYFSMQNEILTMQRTDMLIANAYPLASWGEVDFDRDRLHFVMGISGQALKKAFGVKGVKKGHLLQVPVRGSIRKPNIDTTQAATRLSALVAQNQVASGPQGKLIETLIDAAQDLVTNEKVPPPTTNPLPWAKALQETEEATAAPETIVEQPIKELKKGAKSLIKGILGK